jgi:hypothetical protein
MKSFFRAGLLTLTLSGLIASLYFVAISAESKEPPKAPGLGEPGKLVGLEIVTGAGQKAALRGADDRLQLVVSGKYDSGQFRDLTRKVKYEISPAGIVSIDDTGLVTPLANGNAAVTVRSSEGATESLGLEVKQIGSEPPINFANEISPIFTKLGCNSGGCHGKASGQNGFKLSLLGFEPKEDYEYLVMEARGRRLFPASPERSLLLLKGTNTLPHGGGARLAADSHEYRMLRRWIQQGMPYGSEKDPTVAKIEVLPRSRAMIRGGEQQFKVVAHYTDGSTRDVTRTAQFDANDPEMAEVTATGLVKTLDLTGDVAIMARYQGHVDVFRASIPLGLKVENLPPAKNFVDEAVFAKLKVLGIPPSAVCDDATFLRRVSIDICGRIPTIQETEAFLADKDPAKRDKVIDRLLDSPEYGDYFSNKWASILRIKRGNESSVRANYAFHGWIRRAFIDNMPYDHFVREVLAAAGEVGENPAVTWYRNVRSTSEQVEDTAQLFLGLRIQCARCHHHPFEKWSQQDYYGFSAFFARVGRKPGLEPNEERIFHQRGDASAVNPKTGQGVPPTGLDAPPAKLTAEDDPRHALVDWMSDPSNKFFAHALVNRYWKHFFSRGIVDPEDDMRVTNPASNPELLDKLAQHFVASKFNLKELVRTICRSSVYQLSAEPNDYNKSDKQNYSRYYPKRLNAEVLLDAIDVVTNNTTGFGGLPPGTKAVQLPDSAGMTYFLTVFGKPQGESACECERSSEANLAQSLHLLNSAEVQGKLTNGNSRARLLAGDAKRGDEEKIRELFLAVFSRPPIEKEMKVALAHIAKHVQQKATAYEDILWALINTKEFLFNH